MQVGAIPKILITFDNKPYDVPISNDLIVPVNNPVVDLPNQVLESINFRILGIYLTDKSVTKSSTGQYIEGPQIWLGKWFNNIILTFPELKRRVLVVPSSLIRFVGQNNNIVTRVTIIDNDQSLISDYQLVLITDVEVTDEREKRFGYSAIDSLLFLENNLKNVTLRTRLEYISDKIEYLTFTSMDLSNLNIEELLPDTTIPSFRITLLSQLVSGCYVSLYPSAFTDPDLNKDRMIAGPTDSNNLDAFFKYIVRQKTIKNIINVVTPSYPIPPFNDVVFIVEKLVYLSYYFQSRNYIRKLLVDPALWQLLSVEVFKYWSNGNEIEAQGTGKWLLAATEAEYVDYITSTRAKSTNLKSCLNISQIHELSLLKKYEDPRDIVEKEQLSRVYNAPPLDINSPWIFSISNIIGWYKSHTVGKGFTSDNITSYLSDYLPLTGPGSISLAKTTIQGKILYHASELLMGDYGSYYPYFKLKPPGTEESDKNMKYLADLKGRGLIVLGTKLLGLEINDNQQLTFTGLPTGIRAIFDIMKVYPIILNVNTDDAQEFYTIASDHFNKILSMNPRYQVEVIDNYYRLFVPIYPGPLNKEKIIDLNTPDILIIASQGYGYFIDTFPWMRASYGFLEQDQVKPDLFGSAAFFYSFLFNEGDQVISRYIYFDQSDDDYFNMIKEEIADTIRVTPGAYRLDEPYRSTFISDDIKEILHSRFG